MAFPRSNIQHIRANTSHWLPPIRHILRLQPETRHPVLAATEDLVAAAMEGPAVAAMEDLVAAAMEGPVVAALEDLVVAAMEGPVVAALEGPITAFMEDLLVAVTGQMVWATDPVVMFIIVAAKATALRVSYLIVAAMVVLRLAVAMYPSAIAMHKMVAVMDPAVAAALDSQMVTTRVPTVTVALAITGRTAAVASAIPAVAITGPAATSSAATQHLTRDRLIIPPVNSSMTELSSFPIAAASPAITIMGRRPATGRSAGLSSLLLPIRERRTHRWASRRLLLTATALAAAVESRPISHIRPLIPAAAGNTGCCRRRVEHTPAFLTGSWAGPSSTIITRPIRRRRPIISRRRPRHQSTTQSAPTKKRRRWQRRILHRQQRVRPRTAARI
jgi:hypothetical protein